MKTTKKVLALVLCAVLLVSATVAGTVAWLTAKDEVKNTFAVGEVNIDLWEAVKVYDPDGKELYAGKPDGYNFEGVLPGYKMDKIITVKNTGKNPAFVRVDLKHNNYNAINDAIDEVYEKKTNADGTTWTEAQIQEKVDEIFYDWNIRHAKENGSCRYTNTRTPDQTLLAVDIAYKPAATNTLFDPSNWFKSDAEKASNDYSLDHPNEGASYYDAKVGVDERLYVYYLHLQPGESYTLISGINCPTDFDADQLKMFNGLKIDATAYAIQAQGFCKQGDSDIYESAERAFVELANAKFN